VIRFVGKTAVAWEFLQSAKRVLAVFMARWTRFRQALDPTQNKAVPGGDGPIGVVRIDADDDPGRTPLIRFRAVMRDSRRPQRLFVPIASLNFESFGVTLRSIAPHQHPPMRIVLSEGTKTLSRSHPGIAASAGRCETKSAMQVGSVAPTVASFLP
jgi:hypothetical protein